MFNLRLPVLLLAVFEPPDKMVGQTLHVPHNLLDALLLPRELGFLALLGEAVGRVPEWRGVETFVVVTTHFPGVVGERVDGGGHSQQDTVTESVTKSVTESVTEGE